MNPNDLMKDIYEKMGIKVGYNLNDRKEFQKVRNVLVNNNLPYENFDNNLKSLIIEKYNINSYSPTRNKINILKGMKNLSHELFHMASNKLDGSRNIGSMLESGIGNSLNEGITDYLTQEVELNYDMYYIFEAFYFRILSRIYNGNIILVNHFNGNPEGVYDSFGSDRNLILDITKCLDKYTKSVVNSSDAIDNKNFGDIYISYDDFTDAFGEIFKRYSYQNDPFYDKMLLSFRLLIDREFGLFDDEGKEIYDKFERKLKKG